MQRNFSRKIALFIATVFLATSLFVNTTVVNAASVKDLDKSSGFAREAILFMTNNNVISGDKQGNFDPQKRITRAEIVTLLVKALEIDTSNLPTKANFTDVPLNHWAYKYVEAANRAGVVSGIGNGKFGINNECTREQITMMVMNYMSVSKEAVLADQGFSEIEKFKDESKMSEWAKAAIQFAVSNKLMSGIGSDMFSPTGSATKEQIAVILYKFLNSRDIIQQNADALKKPLVTFNGDILKFTEPLELINSEILVPLELFKKIGAEVTTNEQMDNITIKSSTIAGQNIYLKTGNQTAYINYVGNGDPFNDASAQDKLILLNTAPKKIGNEVLVPMKTVVDALGMKVDWNTKTNLIAVQDSLVVKNPILYNAIKNTLQYKGEYNTSMTVSMRDGNSNEGINILNTMSGAVNGENSTTKSKLSVKITEVPDQNFEYDIVKIADKIYTRDLEIGEWSILDPTEAAEQGSMYYYDVAADRAETQKLLDAYGKINIVSAGKANLNGKEVLKYNVKIDNDIVNEFIPTDLLESGLGIDDLYNKGFDLKMEFYVNMQGQLIGQSANATGGIEYDGYTLNITINATMGYSNIGKDIEIVSPIQ